MKNILIILSASFILSMCTSNHNTNSSLQVKNDSLERIINKKDSAIYTVIETFNEIENNLATIKSKENIISSTVQNIEDKRTREQKINEDINLIYELMKDNKDKVEYLKQQLESAHINSTDLQNTINNLQVKLAEKNNEILELRKNLLDMNLTIDDLTYTLDTLIFDIQIKNSIIDAQDESLNTAYYLFGSKKELKKMEVLDKSGGFIGIGTGGSINQNFNKEYFTKIDIRNKKSYKFNGTKKIQILTTHPSNSYTIYGNKPVDSLVISNIDDFWSVSKYLLISLN